MWSLFLCSGIVDLCIVCALCLFSSRCADDCVIPGMSVNGGRCLIRTCPLFSPISHAGKQWDKGADGSESMICPEAVITASCLCVLPECRCYRCACRGTGGPRHLLGAPKSKHNKEQLQKPSLEIISSEASASSRCSTCNKSAHLLYAPCSVISPSREQEGAAYPQVIFSHKLIHHKLRLLTSSTISFLSTTDIYDYLLWSVTTN